jgi:hypothetical protein
METIKYKQYASWVKKCEQQVDLPETYLLWSSTIGMKGEGGDGMKVYDMTPNLGGERRLVGRYWYNKKRGEVYVKNGRTIVDAFCEVVTSEKRVVGDILNIPLTKLSS